MLKELFPDLSIRSEQAELMDHADLDPNKTYRTLSQFKIINLLFSRSRFLLRKILIPHMLQAETRKLNFVDVGSGGGDIAIWLYDICNSLGIELNIIGLDSNPLAIEFAENKVGDRQRISFHKGSIYDLEKLNVRIDYVFANHLLHHLRDQDIPYLINKISAVSHRGFLINDLKRSPYAFLGFKLFANVFFRGSYHVHDGPLSIKKGFKCTELQNLIEPTSNSSTIQIGCALPFRIYLTCLKPNNL